MDGSDMPGSAILYDDQAGNVLVGIGPSLVIQYRCAPLTDAFLDACGPVFEQFVAANAGVRPFGVVAVVNGNAGITEERLRARQRTLIGELLRQPEVAMVTCILGDTIDASAMRSIGRVMMLGHKNLAHVVSIEDAAKKMAEQLPDVATDTILTELRRLMG